jgi:hypothetical protein
MREPRQRATRRGLWQVIKNGLAGKSGTCVCCAAGSRPRTVIQHGVPGTGLANTI